MCIIPIEIAITQFSVHFDINRLHKSSKRD